MILSSCSFHRLFFITLIQIFSFFSFSFSFSFSISFFSFQNHHKSVEIFRWRLDWILLSGFVFPALFCFFLFNRTLKHRKKRKINKRRKVNRTNSSMAKGFVRQHYYGQVLHLLGIANKQLSICQNGTNDMQYNT